MLTLDIRVSPEQYRARHRTLTTPKMAFPGRTISRTGWSAKFSMRRKGRAASARSKRALKSGRVFAEAGLTDPEQKPARARPVIR